MKTLLALLGLLFASQASAYLTPGGTGTSITVAAPITYSLGVVGCQVADGSTDGCLTHSDWSLFNGKLSASGGDHLYLNEAAGRNGSSLMISKHSVNSTDTGQWTELFPVDTDDVTTTVESYVGYSNYSIDAGHTNGGIVTGGDFEAVRDSDSTNAGTLQDLIGIYGLWGQGNVNASAVTHRAIGLYLLGFDGGGTTDNMYDLFVDADGGTGGTVTHRFGFFGSHPDSGTKYNFFPDKVRIGTTYVEPTETLDVDGSAKISGPVYIQDGSNGHNASLDIAKTTTSGYNTGTFTLITRTDADDDDLGDEAGVGLVNPSIASGKTNTGQMIGIDGEAYRDQASDAGTIQDLIGLSSGYTHGSAMNGAAVTNRMIGLYLYGQAAGGTVTDMYDIYAQALSSAGGDYVTNRYGIYLPADPDHVKINYLAEKLRIGATYALPSDELDVLGSSNVSGYYKIATAQALRMLGTRNVLVGPSGNDTLTGTDNIAMGSGALSGLTAGLYNVAIGVDALHSLTEEYSPNGNTAVGYAAGKGDVTGIANVYLGFNAGKFNLYDQNTFVGHNAGGTGNNINQSVLVGQGAGGGLVYAFNNTFVGTGAGSQAVNVNLDTFVGNAAGATITDGMYNTFVGAGADGTLHLNYALCFGYLCSATANNQATIGGAGATEAVTTVIPGRDNTASLGDATHRFTRIFTVTDRDPDDHLEILDEFPTAAGSLNWSQVATGTGAGRSSGAALDGNHPFIGRQTTGTTTTGVDTEHLGLTSLQLGGGQFQFKTIVSTTALSTVTDEYIYSVGLDDTSTGAGDSDAVRFYYDRLGTFTCTGTTTNLSTAVSGLTGCSGVLDDSSIQATQAISGTGIVALTTVSSINSTAHTLVLSAAATAGGTITLTFTKGSFWNVQAMSGGTASTQVTSNAIVINTPDKLKAVINAGATAATFTINGVDVKTISTNVPTGSSHTLGPNRYIIKSAGTSGRIFDMDYWWMRYDYTTSK